MSNATIDDILALGTGLSAQRVPYALATVVWRRRPTSGKPGRRALVTADGTLHGWIGGACSQPAVVRECLAALEAGQPRLLCLGLETDFATADPYRVVEPITCSSEGAMEVFIEPRLPRPHLVAIGDEPVARAVGSIARTLGFEVTALGPDVGDRSDAHRIVASLDMSRARVDAGSFIVVATMGQYDEDALLAALATEAPYVALVASRTRSKTVVDYLRRHGVSDQALERLHAPAGLDLGPIDHEEIAVAILAEVVQLKAQGVGAVRSAAPVVEEAVDPVCGMTVQVAAARHRAEHGGRTFYFCCAGCKERFLGDPAQFGAS